MTNGRRVVITGIGLTSPLGNSLPEVTAALRNGEHGISVRPEWAAVGNLATRLGSAAKPIDFSGYPKKKIRTMGRVALLSTYATSAALDQSRLDPSELSEPHVGLAYGSTHGSTGALEEFCTKLFPTRDLGGLAGTTYLKFMSNTCAVNLAQYLRIRGRVVSTCAACVSASQAIGAGYELIKFGRQEVMICGGAEELHFTHAGVFDLLYATSTCCNDQPDRSPRPFDVDRDGLVVGEGAGTLVLESLDHATARGAKILGEIVGYGTNCDGTHVTQPSADGMAQAMALALDDAQLRPCDIRYINAHATATILGDVAESRATAAIYGTRTPISSTKGHTGHTLGACGAIELAFGMTMMHEGFVVPTRNLETVDPRCAPLDYICDEVRTMQFDTFMTNNFAFGGVNTSLIVRGF